MFTEKSSRFGSVGIPKGNGTVRGIYQERNGRPTLKIRTIAEVNLNQHRKNCTMNDQVLMITQIADPANASGARYVTLFNSSDYSVSLAGWQLKLYTNGLRSNEQSISIGLLSLPSQKAFVIANKGFESVFGFPPSLVSNKLIGNGDDIYALVNPFGEIVDVFGQWQSFNSKALWHYKDGLAKRKQYNGPSAFFNLDDWQIYLKNNNENLQAPKDFNPFED